MTNLAMSYEPLHHKYRPAIFADLVGQEAIAATLTNAIRQQKIAPAYLFAGPRGTGKTSSARILAKSLNCLEKTVPTEKPCGVCEACRSIANSSALDTIEIDAASNTGVDNIRDLIERSQFAPVQCRYKLYIIDECHMLSTAAFNALLKTLEEPPDRVVFVLATTDPQRVLPTIISRCQRFDFRRIPIAAMVGHLQTIARQETIAIDDEAITLVAQIAQGGLRDAQSLLDQLGLLDDRITIDRVWDLVGAVPERDLMALLEAIADDNPETLLERVRHLMDSGREPPIVLQHLAGFYRDLLIAKTAPHRQDLVAVTPDTWTALCRFAQQWSIELILAGGQHLRGCEGQIKSTTQPRLWLEVALLGLLPSALIPPSANLPAGYTPPRHFSLPHPPAPKSLPEPPKHEPAPSLIVPATFSPKPPPTTAVHRNTTIPSSEPILETPPLENGTSSATEIWAAVLENIPMRFTRELLRQQGNLSYFDGSVAKIILSAGLMKVASSKIEEIKQAFFQVCQGPIEVRLESHAATPPPIVPVQPYSADRENRSTPIASPHPIPVTAPIPTTETHCNGLPSPAAPPETQTLDNSTVQRSPTPLWEEDEVDVAAHRLAEFFNGEVIPNVDDSELEPSAETEEGISLTYSPP
jgi:DNA polymerase III subunit gamma/tau